MRRHVKDHGGRMHAVRIFRREFNAIVAARQRLESSTLPVLSESRPATPIWRKCLDFVCMAPFALGALAAATAFAATAFAVICLPAMAVMHMLGAGWRAGIGLTVGLVLPVVALIAYRQGPQNRADTLRSLGCCGTCGYSLDSLTPGPDGLTVCPECGSSWRHPSQEAACCPVCKTSLGSLPIPEHGLAECPECESPLRIRFEVVTSR